MSHLECRVDFYLMWNLRVDIPCEAEANVCVCCDASYLIRRRL